MQITPGGHYEGCTILDEAISVPPESRFVLHAGDDAVNVSIRRFGHDFTPVGVIPPGSTALVWVDPLLADEPWVVRADGACR